MTGLAIAGWLTSPLFERLPGHPQKVYSEPNTGARGLALHSIEGYGLPLRFWSNQREPADPTRFTRHAAASCKFILMRTEKHKQLYPFAASEWCTGGREANTTTWSIEAEGKAWETLTPHQTAGLIAISNAWEAEYDEALLDSYTVRSHRAIATEHGYAPTACESGRYDQARQALYYYQGEDPNMTPAQVEEIASRLFLPLLAQAVGADEETFTDDERLEAIRKKLALPSRERVEASFDQIQRQLSIVSGAIQRIADGSVEAAAIAASAAEPSE